MLLRDLIIGGVLLYWPHAGQAEDGSVASAPVCGGALSQGGALICEGSAGTQIRYGAHTREIGPEGHVIFGLSRAAPSTISVNATLTDGTSRMFTLDIAPRDDPYRVIEGLDCDRVDARTQAQKDHAGRSWVTKQAGFARFHTGPGASEGFIVPTEGRPTSPFGPVRKYIGVSAVTGEPCDRESVHRGYDIGAPVGTEIIAPASGTVILADPDLYYEGGTVFLDHGGGLMSVFMHMSAVDVAVGDEVSQGDRLGAVGNTGRTTGPHLHWAVKWRDIAADTRDGDFYIDPALLLELSDSR